MVDPEAADVVKRIFAMTIDGYGPYQIASKLKSEKVLTPSAYLAQHGEGVNKNKTFKDVYGWGSSTICNILEKCEYLGHTINFKTRKHFKDKKSHYVPEDEWTIFENAIHLRQENMVKLPVFVMNRNNQLDVLNNAVQMQSILEAQAMAEYRNGGCYIRPIVLFQAQPKGKEDAATFEKIRTILVKNGIPAEQIAIKTADINELKNADLLSPNCPIRFIITVNALKEGWDCPFAYILASLANRTSQVDVEQIVGRILRLPYTRKHPVPALNMSYVLTSSADFKHTLDGIVKGLNNGRLYRSGLPGTGGSPCSGTAAHGTADHL